MPYYCIYGSVPEQITNLVKSLRITDEKQLKTPNSEEPHITIMYGPYIDDGVPEVTGSNTLQEVDNVLGGFISEFKNKPMPKFRITGVSYFDRSEGNILKLEIESSDLTDMQVYLRNNTCHTYDEFRENTKHLDDSYAMPPVRWCHLTLGFIRKEVPIDDLVAKCSNQLRESGCELDNLNVTGIDLITAVTDTRISLW